MFIIPFHSLPSPGSTGDSSNDEEEDVYSGLEEVEEDSKQLQFSFVQSSGTDPVLDIMPDSVCSHLPSDPCN